MLNKGVLMAMVLLVMFSSVSGQSFNKQLTSPGYQVKGWKVDTFLLIPRGTGDEVNAMVGSLPGALRYNTDSSRVEVWSGSAWEPVADSDAGGTGTETDPVATQKHIILTPGFGLTGGGDHLLKDNPSFSLKADTVLIASKQYVSNVAYAITTEVGAKRDTADSYSRDQIDDMISGGGSADFDGNRPITRDFSQVTGVNLATNDLKTTLSELLYPSQAPKSTLTVSYGSVTATAIKIEKTIADSVALTLNWSAGRDNYTDSIASIVVNGKTKTFTQPTPGHSVSGTQTDSLATNSNLSISNVVTTTDGKDRTSFVSVSFQTKWYYGFVDAAVTTPSDADIIALDGQELTTSRVQNNGNGNDIIVANSTNRRFVIVQASALDASGQNQIFVGGLNSTGAFSKTTRTFVNASGYSYQVNIYVLDNTTGGDFKFQIQ